MLENLADWLGYDIYTCHLAIEPRPPLTLHHEGRGVGGVLGGWAVRGEVGVSVGLRIGVERRDDRKKKEGKEE